MSEAKHTPNYEEYGNLNRYDLIDNFEALGRRNAELLEVLKGIKARNESILSEYMEFRNQDDPEVCMGIARLWGAQRVKLETDRILDAAIAKAEGQQ